MAEDKIVIEFDGDIKALKAKLGSTQKEVGRLEKASASLKANLGVVAKAGAIGFGALTAAIGGAISQAAKFETITTQFETLTGSATEATKVVKELQDFTAKTPFQFDSVAQAGKTLLAFGVSVDDLQDKLQFLGDVSSASGKDISELSVIFGQVRASGKLTGERFNQLVESGINIGPAIAQSLGIAEKSIRGAISRGEVDFDTFEKSFKSLAEEGGFAFEGMIKQSKTFSGLMSTVGDNVSLLAASAGNELLPVMKELATQFLGFIGNLRESDSFINTIKSTISGVTTIALGAAEGFEILGTRIGATLATVSEAVSAALNLEFKKAVQIFKGNAEAFRQDVLAIEEGYAEKSKKIDEALYSEKEALSQRSKEKTKKDLEEQSEIKAQAKLDENELLNEIEEELQEQRLENESLRLEQINELTRQKLAEKFDAKRAVEQEDIKASIKENQLRMKEEIRYGKDVAKARSFFRSQEAEAAKMFLNALETLGRTGNKKLVEIAKAASIAKAIMNTAEGVTKALTFGPIIGPPLAATIGAAGAAQVAVIAGAKFADGGMYMGGVPGVDSLPALLQQGELVVPKKNFEEVISAVSNRREGFTEEGQGQTITIALEPTGDFINMIEQKLIETTIQNTGVA